MRTTAKYPFFVLTNLVVPSAEDKLDAKNFVKNQREQNQNLQIGLQLSSFFWKIYDILSFSISVNYVQISIAFLDIGKHYNNLWKTFCISEIFFRNYRRFIPKFRFFLNLRIFHDSPEDFSKHSEDFFRNNGSFFRNSGRVFWNSGEFFGILDFFRIVQNLLIFLHNFGKFQLILEDFQGGSDIFHTVLKFIF